MKKYMVYTAITAILLMFPIWAAAAVDWLAEADKIFDRGGLENYKKSIDLYVKAVEKDSGD